MLSWNINGNILKKLCFIEEFTLNFDIIWMHEHFLNDVTKELTTPMSYFFFMALGVPGALKYHPVALVSLPELVFQLS